MSKKAFGTVVNKNPEWLGDLLKYIEEHPREGCFRKCGDNKKIVLIKKKIDKGKTHDVIKQCQYINNMTSLVKSFYRDMKNSIFEPKEKFIEVSKIQSPKEMRKALRELIKKVEVEKKQMLFQLFHCLWKLSLNPKIKMGSRNLAICLVPNFFFDLNAEARNNFSYMFEEIINNFEYVFNLVDDQAENLVYTENYSTSFAMKHGIKDPKNHIQCALNYKRWLQNTKNLGLIYKREKKKDLNDVLKVLANKIFKEYYDEMIRNRSVVTQGLEKRVNTWVTKAKEYFSKQYEWNISNPQTIKRLHALVQSGIELVDSTCDLKPQGKFFWINPGCRFLKEEYILKNPRKDGFNVNDLDTIVVENVFPGFYVKKVLYYKPGVLVRRMTEEELKGEEKESPEGTVDSEEEEEKEKKEKEENGDTEETEEKEEEPEEKVEKEVKEEPKETKEESLDEKKAEEPIEEKKKILIVKKKAPKRPERRKKRESHKKKKRKSQKKETEDLERELEEAEAQLKEDMKKLGSNEGEEEVPDELKMKMKELKEWEDRLNVREKKLDEREKALNEREEKTKE